MSKLHFISEVHAPLKFTEQTALKSDQVRSSRKLIDVTSLIDDENEL